MKKSNWISFLSIVVLFSLVTLSQITGNVQVYAQGQQASAPQAQPLMIAVVNYMELLEQHPKLVDFNVAAMAELKAGQAKFQAVQADCQKQVNQLQKEMPQGPELLEKIKPIKKIAQEAESQFTEIQTKLQMEELKVTHAGLVDIQNCIAQVAQQKGAIAVLNRPKMIIPPDQKIDERARFIQETQANIQGCGVVFIYPQCDITQDVLALMAQTLGRPAASRPNTLGVSGVMGVGAHGAPQGGAGQVPATNGYGQQVPRQ